MLFRPAGLNRMRNVMNSSVTRSLSSTARRQAQGRIGENWAVAETKRLGPQLIGWSAFIASTLGWPFAFYYWKAPRK
ncbi:hypothetical protein RNJ44_04992 [Nakaseomyces bracarensis]|uniref:Uncharacterized protein n=1 Tax=Nakaseomyces bracarensis TaxID=273131 RepID=A0ABR4NWM5_9SACH